jgi:hypothetical protein
MDLAAAQSRKKWLEQIAVTQGRSSILHQDAVSEVYINVSEGIDVCVCVCMCVCVY